MKKTKRRKKYNSLNATRGSCTGGRERRIDITRQRGLEQQYSTNNRNS